MSDNHRDSPKEANQDHQSARQAAPQSDQQGRAGLGEPSAEGFDGQSGQVQRSVSAANSNQTANPGAADKEGGDAGAVDASGEGEVLEGELLEGELLGAESPDEENGQGAATLSEESRPAGSSERSSAAAGTAQPSGAGQAATGTAAGSSADDGRQAQAGGQATGPDDAYSEVQGDELSEGKSGAEGKSSSQTSSQTNGQTNGQDDAQGDGQGAGHEQGPWPDSAQLQQRVEQLEKELEEARQQAETHRDQALRIRAEMENMQRRAQKDIEQAKRQGLEKVASDLLQVKDSLEMGVQAAEDEQADREKLLEGSQLTLKMLNQVFERAQIEEIDPQGERFNPDYHEAMAAQPSDEQEPNTVLHVVQKGYRLEERLLRPALVVVARKADDSSTGQSGGSVDESV